MSFVNTVDVIGDAALTNSIINGSITGIADNLSTSIGDYAFYGSEELTTADFPTATDIGRYAFNGCSALTTANFPAATQVGEYAFNSCYELGMADFPKVTKVGTYAFNNCSALTALALRSATLATMTNTSALNATPIANGTGYIYVPSALYDSYRADTKWSTYANQFRKLEDYTVDGTINGVLDTNRHMVRFFNGDTLLGYVVVPHGGSATYTGDTPADPSGNSFLGWEPAPTNITADTDCYAVFTSPYTWDAVFAAINAGTYKDIYKVGDLVPLDLGAEGVVNMQIAAFDADKLADGSGYAPITWIAKEALLSKHRMNEGAPGGGQLGVGTNGGWAYCEMRSYVFNDVKPLIPRAVREQIKNVEKSYYPSEIGGGNGHQTTSDTLWIPSAREVRFGGSNSEMNGPTYTDLFIDNNSRTRTQQPADDTTTVNWALRTGSGTANWWSYVTTGGTRGAQGSPTEVSIIIGFCT